MNKKEHELIERLSAQETAIASLYAVFGKALPDMQSFWGSLVEEEQAHAAVIWKLAELCETSDAQINTHAFNIETIQTNIDYLTRQAAHVAANGTTAVKALSLAVDTERGLIDKQFFRIVDSKDFDFAKELKAIEEHTAEHLSRVEKRLREERGQSIKKDVQEGQLAIIDKLTENEAALSDLYNLYATAIPEMHAFWAMIATAEASHASALQTLRAGIRSGAISINTRRFSTHGLNLLSKLVYDALTRAKAGSITAKDAIITALSIESSMLEAEFYAPVKADAEEFFVVAQKLASETTQHVEAMQKALQNLKRS